MWKPFYDNNGDVFLAADYNGTDSATSQAKSGLIYYQGDYYVHTNGFRYDPASISDRGYTVIIGSETKKEKDTWQKVKFD